MAVGHEHTKARVDLSKEAFGLSKAEFGFELVQARKGLERGQKLDSFFVSALKLADLEGQLSLLADGYGGVST